MSAKDESIGGVMKDLPRTGISDKLDHAIAGGVVFIGTFASSYFLASKVGQGVNPVLVATITGLSATVIAAGTIEFLQKHTGSGVASWTDFFATIAPTVVFTGLIYLIR